MKRDFYLIAGVLLATTFADPGAGQSVPVTNDWTYACANALLVIPPADHGPTNTFGILSGRSFVCVTTKPRCGVVWQTLLRDGADSAGFHGKHVILARGRTLTALDVTNGAMSWTYRLAFDPQIVDGDDRVIVASDLTEDGKVVALDVNTGSLLWERWFGKEMRFAGNQPGWISMRPTSAGPSTMLLYWKSALFGKDGPRPTAMAGHSLGEYTALCAAGAWASQSSVTSTRTPPKRM